MISESLFTDKINDLSADDIINNLVDVPSFNITEEVNLVDLLVNNGICGSKREAREMISGNAISINNQKVTDLEYIVNKDAAIENKVLLIKKGKKNYYLGIYN